MKPKLLDLFCSAGGCSMGYSRAGFEVVGVDMWYNLSCHSPVESAFLFLSNSRLSVRVPQDCDKLEKQQVGGSLIRGTMTKTGEVRRGTELGLKDSHLRVWAACPDCGKERWVLLRNNKPQSERCHPCGAKNRASERGDTWLRGARHPRWNGGRSVTKLGYVEVWVDPSDLYCVMAGKDGYVLEHRLVMARHLGRCLDKSEEVHHRNRNKLDNRIENLELLNKREHSSLLKEVKRLAARILELEDELKRKT